MSAGSLPARAFRSHFLLYVLCLLTGVVASVLGCPRSPTAASDEVRGTISVFGATIQTSDILIRARPVLPAVQTEEKGVDEIPTLTGTATRARGSNPAEFEFSLKGLKSEVAYRVGVKIANQEERLYPRLVWSSDRDPVVLGGESHLRLTAHAMLSELETFGDAQGRERATWVSADALDFADPERGTRSFRWRTIIPNVTGGEFQVSLKPFPRAGERSYKPCETNDDAIIFRHEFEAAPVPGEWVELPDIDFHALLLESRAERGFTGRALADSSWETHILPKLEMGMPLYVRVLPKVGRETLCEARRGGVVPEVILAGIHLKDEQSEPAETPQVSLGLVWYNKPVYDARPKAGEVCYRVTKDHKLLSPFGPGTKGTVWDLLAANHMSGVSFGSTVKRGNSFCVPPSKDDDGWVEDFFDGFGSVLSGLVDAIGQLVDFTSKLWEDIQDAVVDAAASAVDSVGIVNCGPNSACRAALETGLEIGLASMGIPPSLPNFDQLIDQGADYLAAQVAAQAGVPSVVSDYASDKAQKFVKEAIKNLKTSHSMPGLPDWLVLDLRYEPASLTLELYGLGKSVPFNARPGIIRNHTSIYAGAFVKLPKHLPKQGLEPPLLFPMVLPPNNEGLPEPPSVTITIIGYGSVVIPPSDYERARWFKKHWIDDRYHNGCYSLNLVALSNPGGIYKLFAASFRTEDATQGCN